MEAKQLEDSRVLYISNFPKNTEKQLLYDLLIKYGVLTSLNIIQKQDFAFAFAEFEDYQSAVCAIRELSQRFFLGMNLKVQFKKQKNRQPQTTFDKKHHQQLKKSHSQINDYESSQSTLPVNSNQNISKNPINQKNLREQNVINGIKKNVYNSEKIKSYSYRFQNSPSLSPSRSRSRSKTKKSSYRNNASNSFNQNRYKQYVRSTSRSPVRNFGKSAHKQRIENIQNQISDIAGMIKHLQKNLYRLEQKLQDYRYDYEEDAKQNYRRRY